MAEAAGRPERAVTRPQKACLHSRVEHGLAGGGRANRQRDLLTSGVLGEEAHGPGFERGEDARVIGESCEDYDADSGELARQSPRCGDAVYVGHAQVHQHHVG